MNHSVLTPADLQALLLRPTERHGPLVIDVRPAALFRRSHIPGSHHLPSGLLVSSELPDRDLVLVAEDDQRARELGDTLHQQGFHRQIRHLQGGLAAWAQAGHPLQPAPESSRRQALAPVGLATLASVILAVQHASALWLGVPWAVLVAPLWLSHRSARPAQLLRRRAA